VLQQTTLPTGLRAQELAYVLPYYWSKNDSNWGLPRNGTPLGTSQKHFYNNIFLLSFLLTPPDKAPNILSPFFFFSREHSLFFLTHFETNFFKGVGLPGAGKREGK